MAVLHRDYRPMPALDRYDTEAVDDEAMDEVTFEEAQAARLRAEREMERRDVREGRVTGRRARLPGALEGDWRSASHLPFKKHGQPLSLSCCSLNSQQSSAELTALDFSPLCQYIIFS